MSKRAPKRPSARWVELLESRRLLSVNGAPAQPVLPPIVGGGTQSNFSASSLAAGPDGNLWFTDQGNNAIGRESPSGSITEFPLPTDGAGPDQIAAGPDGNLWFVETNAAQIGKITTHGAVTEFALPSSDTSSPISIAAGPLGDLWFVDAGNNDIGRITPQGRITEFPIDGNTLTLNGGIVKGPDGDLWAAAQDDSGDGELARLTPAGKLSTVSLPAYPNALAVGSDGNLWVAADGEIDRVTAAGGVTSFALPNSDSAFAIAPGPDGALWFATDGTNPMGRITTGGTVAQFNPPGLDQNSSVNDLTSGPGNLLWYAATTDTGGPIFSLSPQKALLASGSDLTVNAGSAASVTVASFIDLAPGADASFYQASIDWGDGTTSAGAIAPNANGGFDVSGTHTYGIGSFNVTVTVTDARPAADDSGGLVGRTALAYTSITAPAPPTQGTGVNIDATAGQLFNGVVARYTGVLLNSLSSYSASIDWGDGHVSTGTIAADGSGGVTVSGNNRYAQSGSYTIGTSLYPWDFGPIYPVVAGTGRAVGALVAASGAAAGGTVTTPIVPIPEPPIVPLPPIPEPRLPGPNQTASTATVAPGVMDGTGYSLLASSKEPFQNIVASFALTDPNADLSHFHATVNWDDPAAWDWFVMSKPPIADAPITPDGKGGFTVSVETNFTQPGLFHYSVLISDDRLGSGDAAIIGAAYGQVIVDTPIWPFPLLAGAANGKLAAASAAGANRPNPSLAEHVQFKPVAVHHAANSAFSGDLGILSGVVSTAPNLAELSGTINWGDGSPPAAARFVRDRKGKIHVRGVHTFAAAGSDAITLSLTQTLYQNSTPLSSPAIRLPTAQTVAHISAGGRRKTMGYRGTPVTIHATVGKEFVGEIGTLTGPALTSGQSLEATIFWGDGTRSAASLVSASADQWQVLGTHTYARKGPRMFRAVIVQTMSNSTGTPAVTSVVVARFSGRAIVSPD